MHLFPGAIIRRLTSCLPAPRLQRKHCIVSSEPTSSPLPLRKSKESLQSSSLNHINSVAKLVIDDGGKQSKERPAAAVTCIQLRIWLRNQCRETHTALSTLTPEFVDFPVPFLNNFFESFLVTLCIITLILDRIYESNHVPLIIISLSSRSTTAGLPYIFGQKVILF
jgi:hypothetical protein